MVRPRARDDAISDWVILLALVVTVAIVLGAYYVVFTPQPAATASTAQVGDTVYINYIGTFPNSGTVFDTSLASVAKDNSTYPKAYSFSLRTSYSTLQFTIGDGTVIKGFDDGVRGLAQGQSTTISVPASLGYGAGNATAIVLHALTETVPVRVTMDATAFSAYYGQPVTSATNVTDPIYGWSATTSVVQNTVVVTNSPYPSEVIHPYGAWTAVVLSVDDTANNGTGVITIQNHLDPSQVDRLGGKSPTAGTFYLSAVDLVAGTYTLDFNKQVVGRTLVFQVTLVTLSKAV